MNIIHAFNVVALDAVSYIHAAGLKELWTTFRSDWLFPLFFAGVAIFALLSFKDKSWTKLLSFIGIAAVVGVLIFAGEALIGRDGNSGLSGVANNAASKITTVVVEPGDTVLPMLPGLNE